MLKSKYVILITYIMAFIMLSCLSIIYVYNIQMSNQESNLFIWGKNYQSPTLIRSKVLRAAVGESHIIFTTHSKETYGFGSNRFGQLGLKEPQFYQQPIAIFEGFNISNVYCGAEHSFFINDKNEVYSTGLNIKGQLGLSHFENINSPKLVASLLPLGTKNTKAMMPNINKPPKSPIIEILQKFDLQVKIDQANEKPFLLNGDEYIVNIAGGALFTVVLSNKSRVFVCGSLGNTSSATLDEQLEKSKFKQIAFSEKIEKISAGLSGATAITVEGIAYFWGKFGKNTYGTPKKVEIEKKGLMNNSKDLFADGKVGDQFAVFLTSKGEIVSFGENIDGQLGCETLQLTYKDNFSPLPNYPLAKRIAVGRNGIYAVEVESGELFGWGSNRYGQIFPKQSLKGLIKVTNSKLKLQQNEKIYLSSYFTVMLTKRTAITAFEQGSKAMIENEQKIPASQYKKLLNDYQLLKAINMSLLQKYQPTRRQNKEVQTTSKFQISGITQHRKFNSNTQIAWKEIQLESQINQGGYGVIYRARWRQIPVVVKKFKIENGDVSLRDFLSQCHAMEAVRHPNIVMFLGAVTTNPHYSLILQYCQRGSLWSYLQNKENNITWEQRRRLAIQIAQGVLYLHECTPPILHRDLKSLNIFLDVNLRIKIGDFGWTKTLEEYMTNKIGTYQWMAPQVIGNKPYTEKADVFSYSIILWQIASREPPYRNINGAKVSQDVLNRQLRPTIPQKCPEVFSKLMKKCWQSDPNKRPSFRQIIRQLQLMKLNVA